MVKNFWLLHENHDNKVDENAMFQVRTQKKRVCHKSMAHPLLCYLLHNPRSIVAYSKKGII